MQKDIILYQTKDGQMSLEVNLKEETVWLNQKQMALLFDKNSDTIGLHIKNIFKTGELISSTTTEDFSVVWMKG